jgi:cell division protein FtsN
MSRDTKPRKGSRGLHKKSGGGTLLGLFIGLIVGVLAAAAVVWYIYRTPPPFSSKPKPPVSQPGASQTPLALPGKPGDPLSPPPPNDKPRFDFYKMLPGDGETASDPKTAAPKTAAPKPASPKPAEADRGKDTLKEMLFLQTGSFQNAGDADNQKAGLAMAGLEASVQQVMLQDKVWYRVRLGPFRKMEEVSAVRAELARQGIEANIVKKD